MTKNRKMILGVAALIVAAALFLGVYFITRPETVRGAKTFTVTVVHRDETAKTFTYHTDQEYLGKALLDKGLIQGEDGPYGLYVTTVDGETADYDTDGGYWALYQGEEYAMQGIDQTPVADGDTFSLVYTA